MRILFAASTLLVASAFGFGSTASASVADGTLGPCNGTVDVVCSHNGTGCTLWYNYDCVIG